MNDLPFIDAVIKSVQFDKKKSEGGSKELFSLTTLSKAAASAPFV